MQGKSHLFFLVDDQNRSLYVDGQTVKTSAVPRPLVYTPDGWTRIEISNQRNTKYFALDRNFSIPLDFVEDGAMILKDAYYKRGVEAKVYLVILKQKIKIEKDGGGNITGYGYYYDGLYKGEIDFSNFQHAGPKVSANLMEGGIPKLIKANENTKYEIEVDVPEAVYIEMDGINLAGSRSWIAPAVQYTGEVAAGHLAPIQFLNGEMSQFGLVGGSQSPQDANSYMLLSTTDGQAFNWSGELKLKVNNYVFLLRVAVQKRLANGSTQNVDFTIINDPTPGNVYTFPFNYTNFILNKDEKLQIGVICGGVPASVSQRKIDYLETNFQASFTYRNRTTYIKALPPLYVYKKLMEKIGASPVNVDSTILSQYSNIPITCGDAIRGIPGAKIKSSLSDFFTSYDAQLDLGMGEIAGIVRMEPKSYWVDYSNPIDLGEVKGFKIKPATDYIFNTLKFGYPEQSYDDVNGKQEFNNTSLFTTPYTRVAKELNKTSVYRADCYGIEFTRINLEGKSTTDNTSDNDVFLIHVQSTPTAGGPGGQYYKLDRSLNATATGVLEPSTIFNVFLSPKRLLLRNGGHIHSLFYKMDTGKLVFQTTEKNAEFRTTSPLVVEKADVTIGSLLPAIFGPNLLEFETPSPVNLIEALDASPVRAFSGTYLGVPFLGIPVKVSIATETYEEQDYSLLAAPTMNLEPFIQIFE